jgi:hypothetical protein
MKTNLEHALGNALENNQRPSNSAIGQQELKLSWFLGFSEM